ncbi:MAG: HlyC/CorC family transporter [Gemmatimonadaceae bacterium]|nr:HlyC/CorC family transporter [Gemmatimonadaceae bacterium]
MLFLSLAVITALILINALYVAAEFAAVSVRRSRVQSQADDGSQLAARLLPIINDPRQLDTYVAACQIGITLSSLIVGAFAQARLAPTLVPVFERFGSMQQVAAQSTSAVVILVVLTIVQMVFGELVPKSLALQTPTRVALLTVIPMQWSLRLLAWFIRVLNGSGAVLLRILGVPETSHRHVHSAAELEYLVAESGKGGLLKPDEQLRLRHALQLSDRSVRDLMIPRTRIVALDVAASLDEIVQAATEHPYTRYPVYDESIDHVIGVVHVREIAQVVDGVFPIEGLRGIMRPVLVLPDTLRADQLLVHFKAQRRTMAVLADEFGGTAGLITVDDVLEELIGDLADEFRPADQRPERLPGGRVRLPGDMLVEDATPWVRTRWTPHARTVGGLVTATLGRLPSAGESLEVEGVPVEVEAVDRRMVRSVVVTPQGREGADG